MNEYNALLFKSTYFLSWHTSWCWQWIWCLQGFPGETTQRLSWHNSPWKQSLTLWQSKSRKEIPSKLDQCATWREQEKRKTFRRISLRKMCYLGLSFLKENVLLLQRWAGEWHLDLVGQSESVEQFRAVQTPPWVHNWKKESLQSSSWIHFLLCFLFWLPLDFLHFFWLDLLSSSSFSSFWWWSATFFLVLSWVEANCCLCLKDIISITLLRKAVL